MSRSKSGNPRHPMAVAFKTKGEYAMKLLRLAKKITPIEGRRGFPWGTLTIIGGISGLSRERVRQLSYKLAITPLSKLRVKGLLHLKCAQCGKEFHPSSRRGRFCSPECRERFRKEKYFTTFKCEICGKEKEIMRSRLLILTSHFCSKYCQGVWLARHGRIKRRISVKLRALVAKYGDGVFSVVELKKDFGYLPWKLWKFRKKGYMERVGTGTRGRGMWKFTPKALKKVEEQEKEP